MRTLSVRPGNQKNAKVGHKGRGLRHVTYFYNFGTCSISVEWVKLETLNLVRGLIAWPTNQKMQELVKMGRVIPFIALQRIKLYTPNLVQQQGVPIS